MTLMKYLLCVAILAVSLRNVRADSDEEKSPWEHLYPVAVECSKELGADEEALKKAKEEHSIDGIDKCIFGCVFKKIEFIDDKGMFDLEKTSEKLKGKITDADKLEEAIELFKKCEKVNEEDVNDEEAGCERAELLLHCIIENKS